MEAQMSALNNNRRLYRALFFILLSATLYVAFYFSLSIRPLSDDVTFLNAATSGVSTFDYLSTRYFTWTGRMTIEAIMFTSIGSPIAWKLAIPSCLLLAAYSIWKSFFADKLDYNLGIPICLLCILAVSHTILASTVFYITGFYNYLLPVSCGLFASAVYIKPSSFTTFEKIAAIPLVVIASQSEQVGLSITVIFAACLILDHKHLALYRTFLLFIVATGFILLITAPGNYVRFASEIIYMPEFNNYSLSRKILNGFDVFNAHYINPENLYPKAIAILIALLTFDKKFELKKTATTIAILGVLQGSLFSNAFFTGDTEHYSIQYLSSGLGLEYFASYALTIASLVSITYIMKRTLEDTTSFYFSLLLLLLHVGVTTLLGLSPTVYESGFRALFVGDIIGLMLILLLFRSVAGWPASPVLPNS